MQQIPKWQIIAEGNKRVLTAASTMQFFCRGSQEIASRAREAEENRWVRKAE